MTGSLLDEGIPGLSGPELSLKIEGVGGELEFDELTLDVYYKNGKEQSAVYEDAQDGYDYNKGRYSYRTFSVTGKEKQLIIQQHKVGEYETTYQTIKINLVGLPFNIKRVELDNEELSLDKMHFNGENFLIVDKHFTELHIIGE